MSAPKARNYTVSIAVPGSILENAQSIELRTYLAGQIARAAAVFVVQEVVIYDDRAAHTRKGDGKFEGMHIHGDCNIQLARILQYLECPQYLRKSFFPKHKDLQYAGLLNPLDCPHHARESEDTEFREGIVLPHPVKLGKGSIIDVGVKKRVQIDKVLEDGMRVTVRMNDSLLSDRKQLRAQVVSSNTPWREAGIYWGYTVRVAHSFSTILSECPYRHGYDLVIGTSDKGKDFMNLEIPPFKHLLMVFGGLEGIETAMESDERLGDHNVHDVFHYYVNTCPNQGSRTIRTEEAILISLSGLQPKIHAANTTASSMSL